MISSVEILPKTKKLPKSFGKLPKHQKRHLFSHEKIKAGDTKKNILCVWKNHKSKDGNTCEISLVEASKNRQPQRNPQPYQSYKNIVKSKNMYAQNFFQMLYKNMEGSTKAFEDTKATDMSSILTSKELKIPCSTKSNKSNFYLEKPSVRRPFTGKNLNRDLEDVKTEEIYQKERVTSRREVRRRENLSKEDLYSLRGEIVVSRLKRGQSQDDSKTFVLLNHAPLNTFPTKFSNNKKKQKIPNGFKKNSFKTNSRNGVHNKTKVCRLKFGKKSIKRLNPKQRNSIKRRINRLKNGSMTRTHSRAKKPNKKLENKFNHKGVYGQNSYEKLPLDSSIGSTSHSNIQVKDRISAQISIEKLKSELINKESPKSRTKSPTATLKQHKLYQNLHKDLEKLSGKPKEAYNRRTTKGEEKWMNKRLTEMNSQRLNIQSSADDIHSRKIYCSSRQSQAKSILQQVLGSKKHKYTN
ncbi:unnamed protein product [Moneuplotes crassus]|uniref:Uncharacterized protein n=1 Tax=Euplotes crassus TaxID=5936 RepID=A0AAD1YAS6_EUPCR|nr:unnamed protein product [Moneuplotes crassus]